MKKILSTLLLTIVLVNVSAQSGYDPRFFNNQFISLGGGVTLYNNQQSVSSGINGEITWGNWVLNDVAMRLAGGMVNATNAIEQPASFLMGRIDVMFDAINIITKSYDEKRLISAYPMFGFGLINRSAISLADTTYKADLDVTLMLGAQCEFRIPALETWPLFVEAKLFMLPQGYDFNQKMGSFYSVTAGLKHDINYYPHHRALYGESKGWGEDLFVGFGGGVSCSVLPLNSPDVVYADRIGWNADITVGRNFSDLWTMRLGFAMFQGMTEKVKVVNFNAEPYNYDFFNMRVDVMFNVLHLFAAKQELMPYIGAGLVERFDNRKWLMEANAGLFARWPLTGHIDLYGDVRYVMVPPRFASTGDGSLFGTGYSLCNVGLLYNFEPFSVRNTRKGN